MLLRGPLIVAQGE